MKVRIKFSGLVVDLEDGSTIDRSFYEEIKDTQEFELKQEQEVAEKRKYKKRKNNDNK